MSELDVKIKELNEANLTPEERAGRDAAIPLVDECNRNYDADDHKWKANFVRWFHFTHNPADPKPDFPEEFLSENCRRRKFTNWLRKEVFGPINPVLFEKEIATKIKMQYFNTIMNKVMNILKQ